LSETRVKNTTTGTEMAGLFTGLNAIKINNPDLLSKNSDALMRMPKWFKWILILIFLPEDFFYD
jgi:hypothetical protein